jgi:hypothetical protein
MQIQQKFTYILEVNRPELRLIGLALAGKLRPNSSDSRDALVLNQKLLEMQAHELSNELGRIDGALERCVVTTEPNRTGSPAEP